MINIKPKNSIESFNPQKELKDILKKNKSKKTVLLKIILFIDE